MRNVLQSDFGRLAPRPKGRISRVYSSFLWGLMFFAQLAWVQAAYGFVSPDGGTVSSRTLVQKEIDPSQRPVTAQSIRENGAVEEGIYAVGDMLFSEDSLKEIERREQLISKSTFAGSNWPGGNVGFQLPENISAWQRDRFIEATRLWSDASGVRFIETTSGNRISVVTNTSRCSSFVGFQNTVQIMNLGPGCWSVEIIAHELGHALGMVHEHQRPDRGSFLTVTTTDNGGGTASCNSLITTNWGFFPGAASNSSYDFASVMHYRAFGSLQSENCPQGVQVEIAAIASQPPGLPLGSEAACSSPSSCTMIMGRGQTVSQRDSWGMALRYGHRLTVSVDGGGGGAFSVSGQRDSCGTNCWLVSPLSTFRVSASPAQGSFARFSGLCRGRVCEVSPMASGNITITFINREQAVSAMGSILSRRTRRADGVFDDGFESQKR